MLIEILYNVMTLNFGYFAALAAHSLFWIFGFAAAAYIYGGEKGFIPRFIIILFTVLGMLDLEKIHGLTYFFAGALLTLYLGRIAVLTALANSKNEKYIPLAYSIMSYAVLFYFNFFG